MNSIHQSPVPLIRADPLCHVLLSTPHSTVTVNSPWKQPHSYFMFKQNTGLSVHKSAEDQPLFIMMLVQCRACYWVMDCVLIPLAGRQKWGSVCVKVLKQIATECSWGIFVHIYLLYCSFCHGWTLNEACSVKEPPTTTPTGCGAITLHLVVHPANETRGGWKEECDKLSSHPEAEDRFRGRRERGASLWQNKSIN